MAAACPSQEVGDAWGTGRAEPGFYRIVEVPLPRELALEAGSFCMLPDGKLAVGTRRGEILLVPGAFDARPEPRVQTFASGLDEVLGLGFRDGAFYATQQTELTRITDRDGDGRADRFENLGDAWGFAHYHEFAWGSPVAADGSVYVVLGLSESYYYRAPFRGWAFQITPDGRSIPIASGIRSAGGVAPNEHGVMFYAERRAPGVPRRARRRGGRRGRRLQRRGRAHEPLPAPEHAPVDRRAVQHRPAHRHPPGGAVARRAARLAARGTTR